MNQQGIHVDTLHRCRFLSPLVYASLPLLTVHVRDWGYVFQFEHPLTMICKHLRDLGGPSSSASAHLVRSSIHPR